MATPFGLAYGIGAGISAGVPEMEERRRRASDEALRRIQIEEARRRLIAQQREDERLATEDRIYSDPIPEKTVRTPVYEQINAAESAPGVSAVAMQQEAGGNPVVSPQQTIQTQVGETEQPFIYDSPYEKTAEELSYQAEQFRKAKMGRTAYKLQVEADKAAIKAREDLSQIAARRGMLQDFDGANSVLKKLKSNISLAPSEDPGMIRLNRGEGEFADVPIDQLGVLTSKPEEFAALHFKKRSDTEKAVMQAKAAYERSKYAQDAQTARNELNATVKKWRGNTETKDKWVQRVETLTNWIAQEAIARGETTTFTEARAKALAELPPPGKPDKRLGESVLYSTLVKRLAMVNSKSPEAATLRKMIQEIEDRGAERFTPKAPTGGGEPRTQPDGIIPAPKPAPTSVKKTESWYREQARIALTAQPHLEALIKKEFKLKTGKDY